MNKMSRAGIYRARYIHKLLICLPTCSKPSEGLSQNMNFVGIRKKLSIINAMLHQIEEILGYIRERWPKINQASVQPPTNAAKPGRNRKKI